MANTPPSEVQAVLKSCWAELKRNTTLVMEYIPGLALLEPLVLLSGETLPSIFCDLWPFLLRELPMSTTISGHIEIGESWRI